MNKNSCLHLPNKLKECGRYLWISLWNLCFISMKKPIFSKVATFLLARTIESYVKWMLDSERAFKIKRRLRWTVFKILLTSAIICIYRAWHGNEIVQYLQNYKCHEFDQGHSRKLLQSSTSYIQIENTKTTRLLFKDSWILLYFWHSNWHNFDYISGKVAKPHFLENPQKSLKTCQHSFQ